MPITVNVNGRPMTEAFLIASLGARSYPVSISLGSTDRQDPPERANLHLQAGNTPVELSHTTVTRARDHVLLTAQSTSKRRNDIVLQVEAAGSVVASMSFTAMSNPRLRFQGRFEARFATNTDFYNDRRGTSKGWTWALEGEPDFVPAADSVPLKRRQPVGRAIRFHDPVGQRPHVEPSGVFVTAVEGDIDTSTVVYLTGDPVIGEKVALGPHCYFASNLPQNPADPKPFEQWPDGLQPLECFEVMIGSRFFGRSKELTDRPQARGLRLLSPEERQQYGIVDLDIFRENRRQVLLNDYRQLPEPRNGMPQGRNLEKRIAHLGGSNEFSLPSLRPTLPAGYNGKEEYMGTVNDALDIKPADSPVMQYFAAHNAFSFFARFFNFHSDALCGRVDGTLGVLTEELMTLVAPAPLAISE